MSISRQPGRQVGPALRRRALDVFGLAVALAFLPEVVGARAGVVLEPHPGWIAVLVLAARYGSGGPFTGPLAAGGAVGSGSAGARAPRAGPRRRPATGAQPHAGGAGAAG